MGKYDFDKVTDRRGTGAVKYDGLRELFGDADLTPLWVADMDFQPSCIRLSPHSGQFLALGYRLAPEAPWPGGATGRAGIRARRG